MAFSSRFALGALVLALALVSMGADGLFDRAFCWLLSIDRGELSAGSDWRLEFHWLPRSWQAFVALGLGLFALALVGFLYIKEGADVSPFKRALLAVLRLGALAVAAVVLFGPNVRAVQKMSTDSVFLVLVDRSTSMGLADKRLDEAARIECAGMADLGVHEVPETARIELANRLFANPKLRLLSRLAEKNDVRIYSFDSGLAESGRIERGKPAPEWKKIETAGNETDIARAIKDAREAQEGDRRIAGILVVSDGQFNSGGPPYAEAKRCGALGLPIWVVGLGDDKTPKSVSLIEFTGKERVHTEDEVPLTAHLQHRGMKGMKVDVVLERAEGGSDEFHEVEDGRQTVEFTEEGAQPAAAFLFKPGAVGDYEFRVSIDRAAGGENALPDDVTIRQGTLRKTVRVIDNEEKVLLVSGTASYEYRILKNLLIREKSILLDLWLQSATKGWPQKGDGELPLDHLPLDFGELRQYDLLILIDVNPKDLSPDRIDGIERYLTREGGGLLFICGEAYTQQTLGEVAFEKLLDVLPVVPEADPLAIDSPASGYAKEWKVQTPENFDHPLLKILEDQTENRELWPALPPFYWYFPVKQTKPMAGTLLERVDPEDGTVASESPTLAAFGFYGPGRVLFMATDSTYLWRSTHEAVYEMFWLGAARYLMAGRLFGGQKRATVTLTGEDVVPESNRTLLPLGGKLEIRVTALDSNYIDPLKDNEVQVEIQHLETKERWHATLAADRDLPGNYRGAFHPAQVGEHAVTLLGFHEEEAEPRRFLVREPQGEIDTPEMNRAALVGIVQSNREGQSEAAGGAAGAARGANLDTYEELAALPDRVPSKAEEFQILGKRQEIWSSPAPILLFVFFLGLEWYLRKRSNLI